MFDVSNTFHTAVKNGNKQFVLFRWSNHVATNEDICISEGGMNWTEPLNTDDDVTMGKAVSSNLSFDLINWEGQWNDFDFDGEFTAYLGVNTETAEYTQTGDVYGYVNNTAYVGKASTPYLTVGGETWNAPNPVRAMIVDGNTVYVVSTNDQVTALRNGEVVSNDPYMNQQMQHKACRLKDGECYTANGRFVNHWQDGVRTLYELCPLGVYRAERPKVVMKRLLSINCYDRMMLFEDGNFEKDSNLTFPITMTGLLAWVCGKVGVASYPSEFTNSTLQIPSMPKNFDGASYRDILAWIAEASCSYARMNRTGGLELFWYGDGSTTAYSPSDYRDFQPYFYSTRKIGKLSVRNSSASNDYVVGETSDAYPEHYLITENPILNRMASSVRTTAMNAILNRLKNAPVFVPCTVSGFMDWSLQAGDMPTVTADDAYYSTGSRSTVQTYSIPVYTMSMKWDGYPLTEISSTGNKERAVPSKRVRQSYGSSRSTIDQINAVLTKLESLVVNGPVTCNSLIVGSSGGTGYIALNGKFITTTHVTLVTGVNVTYTDERKWAYMTDSGIAWETDKLKLAKSVSAKTAEIHFVGYNDGSDI